MTNWPWVTSVSSVFITLGFFGVVDWWSIRDRTPHWALIVGIAALCDPLANWATFTVFDANYLPLVLSTQSSQIEKLHCYEMGLYDDYGVPDIMINGLGFGLG